jgi:hypothetical protein
MKLSSQIGFFYWATGALPTRFGFPPDFGRCVVIGPDPRDAANPRAIEAEAERRRRLNVRNRRQRDLYGPAHRRRRRLFAQRLERGELIVCPRCNQPVGPDQHWDLGHDDFNPSIERPEHRGCNRAAPNRLHTSRDW